MTKGIKIMLIVAGSLAVLGLVLVAVGWLLGGAPRKTAPKTETVAETFRSISLQEITADVQLLPAEDGVCRVEYAALDDMPLSVSVEDGALTIRRRDERAWYRKISLFGAADFGVTRLYLPQAEYDDISLVTVTGDVSTALPLDVGSLRLQATTGDLSVQNLTVHSAELRVTTGDIQLQNVVASESLQLHSVSGDLTLTDCDADWQLVLATTTGDITASLRSPKRCTTHCVTGKVRIPPWVEGAAECSASCVTGNITITVKP